MKLPLLRRCIAAGVCLTFISSSSFGFTDQSLRPAEEQLASMPVIDITLDPRTVILSDGKPGQVTAEVVTGIDKDRNEPSSVTSLIRRSLGLTTENQGTFPIKRLVVVPQNTDSTSILNLRQHVANIGPCAEADIETVSLPDHTFRDWFMKNNNIVYSIIRFVLNGTTVGATLIYSLKVPVVSALMIGMLAGSMSGFFQYKIVPFRNWLLNDEIARNLSFQIYEWDGPVKSSLKEFYNTFLNVSEQYGKFGLTETVYIAIARIAMWLLDVPSVYYGLVDNAKNVFRTALQSTMAQGVADLGLFKDLQEQEAYRGWSDEYLSIFRNTSTFLISAASVAISALQLVRPDLGGVIDLGFFEMPAGFAAITAVGLGFYIHALLAYWFGTQNTL